MSRFVVKKSLVPGAAYSVFPYVSCINIRNLSTQYQTQGTKLSAVPPIFLPDKGRLFFT